MLRVTSCSGVSGESSMGSKAPLFEEPWPLCVIPVLLM